MNGRLCRHKSQENNEKEQKFDEFLEVFGEEKKQKDVKRRASMYEVLELRKDPEAFGKLMDVAMFIERYSKSGKVYEFNFSIHYETQFGEHIVVTGEPPFLGSWDPHQGLALEWTSYNNWKITLLTSLPHAQDFQYKYVLLSSTKTLWEAGQNHFCSIFSGTPSETHTIFTLQDTWQHS